MRLIDRGRRVWRLALPLCAAAVAAAVLLSPEAVGLIPLLVVLPAISALMYRDPWPAVLTGVVALAGCLVADILDRESWLLVSGTLLAIVAGGGVAVICALIWRRCESQLAELSAMTSALRRILVRPVPSLVGTWRADLRYVAPGPLGGVGGDLCEVVNTSFGTRTIIGDVRGKGLPAAERAADVLGAFRQLAHAERSLVGVALRLDSYLASRGNEIEDFTTALLIEVPVTKRFATLVHCGHPPPLLLRQDSVILVEPLIPGAPLGLGELSLGQYTEHQIPLVPGDRLLLYTDGVTEARGPTGTCYPLAERVRERIDSADLIGGLEQDLVRHTGGHPDDDATLLLLTDTTAEAALGAACDQEPQDARA